MEKSPRKLQALMIRPASLPSDTKALLQIPTPIEFVKTRPGKGGKSFTYIEVGYVIARLNQAFSPVGWDFEVIDERVEANEVVVRGKITIKDHKNGFSISKTQYGTKERHAGVPLGDTLKAAASDCLKKCASLIGVGLDVYWQQLDEDKLTGSPKEVNAPKKEATISKTRAFEMLLDKIKAEKDQTILSQYFEKVDEIPFCTAEQKAQLKKAIADQRKKYVKETNGGQKGMF